MTLVKKISTGFVASVLVFGMAGPANSTGIHGQPESSVNSALVEVESQILLRAPEAPEGSQWYGGEELLKKEISQVDPGTSLRLNPITIGLCNAGFGDKKVETFASKHDEDIVLYCGDSNSGYIHIRERHEEDWEKQKGGEKGHWDDYMVFVTRSALESPSYSAGKPNDKRCYTTPIEVYEFIDGNPVKQKTFNPTVMVSVNNKKVITSYPTNNHRC